MLNINKILLATDFSEGAEERVAFARRLARVISADLHVLYAHVLHGEPHLAGEDRPESEAEARDALEQLVGRSDGSDAADEVALSLVVERNVAPAPAILDYAHAEDIDIIVLGTHGRRGLRRLILGSVAEEVLRLAPCPVLTLRPRTAVERDHQLGIKSILVPIDFSEHSAKALVYAKELAALFNAHLDLLHVVEETLHPAFYGITVQSIYDVQPDIEEKSKQHMRDLLERTAGPNVDAVFEARPGKAGPDIVEYAEERKSDLVVMGTHGLTGLEHFLMGSTTERVLRRSPAPVLAVKSFGKSLVRQDTDS